MPDQYVKLPDGSWAQFPEGMSDDDISKALSSVAAPAKPHGSTIGTMAEIAKGAAGLLMPASTQAQSTLPDLAIGAGKSLLRSGIAGGKMLRAIPGVDAVANALPSAQVPVESTNNVQRAGGALETTAELVSPAMATGLPTKAVVRGMDAIPTTAKAGAKFQEVMGAASRVPVDISGPGDVALRIQQLADRGGSMPMAVRKFIARATDPEKGPILYEEARDFASNISRLSANEYQRLTPAVAREVANLRVALNQANARAAGAVGKGAEYAQAMNEYARAMRVRSAIDDVVQGAKRAVPLATGAGAAYWLTQKIKDLLPGD